MGGFWFNSMEAMRLDCEIYDLKRECSPDAFCVREFAEDLNLLGGFVLLKPSLLLHTYIP